MEKEGNRSYFYPVDLSSWVNERAIQRQQAQRGISPQYVAPPTQGKELSSLTVPKQSVMPLPLFKAAERVLYARPYLKLAQSSKRVPA
jgi:hypothetical protein